MSTESPLPTIYLGSPGEDISKKDLHTICQRFKNLTQLQIQRIQSYLHPRQQAFLKLLPLLFHQNIPLLPGFVSTETPAGIPDYTPSKDTLKEAKLYSKNFKFTKRALRKHPIWGLFLMGSVSSVAFSKTSDMDIWLCHDPDLSTDELIDLQKKANAVEHWAESIQLEVHFFLMNSKSFKNGQDIAISSESSGKTQHYLLLEEFYRTAIYIAGRFPAWWLVPPHEEMHYTAYIEHLTKNKFITENEFIDFGGLDAVPVDEFISATLWHIYKAISSPHKSFLKLLLMEAYASEYPNTQWLCLDLKKAIYQGNFKPDELDPYFLIYKKIDDYLTQTNMDSRLALARESFYLKITGFYQNKDLRKKHQLNQFVQDIAERWDWPKTLIPGLANQNVWTIQKATHEHKIMIRHLSHGYREIKNFSSKHLKQNHKTSEDLRLIGNSLLAFLQKKPGKIQVMSTKSTIYTTPSELSIIEIKANSSAPEWHLHAGQINRKNQHQHESITSGQNLIEILTWLCINDLYQRKLKLHLDSPSSELSPSELHLTLNRINLFLTEHVYRQKDSLDKYKKNNKVISSLLFINLTRQPNDNDSIYISQQSAPFCYGSDKNCFINTTDLVSISQWGEITTQHEKNIDGLFDAFCTHLNNHSEPISKDSFTPVCFTSAHANNINFRVNRLYESLVQLFNSEAEKCSRYFMSAGFYLSVFQKNNNNLEFRFLYSRHDLLEELSTPQKQACSLIFEQELLAKDIIPFLYTHNIPQTIQIFYLAEPSLLTLYFIDENGALFVEKNHTSSADQLLARYAVFFNNVIKRYFKNTPLNVLYYKLYTDPFIAEPCYLDTGILRNNFLNLCLSGEFNTDDSGNFTLSCNDKEFSSIKYGTQVFNATANYIFQFRQNQKNYPIHISDIDIPRSYLKSSPSEKLQSIHILKFKQRIEQRLNMETNYIV